MCIRDRFPSGISIILEFLEINFEPNYTSKIGDYILFTDSESLAKSIISSFKDGNTIQNDLNFSNLLDKLSNVNSGIWVHKTESLNKKENNSKFNFDFKNFPLVAIQWINDIDFAHLHLRFGKNQPRINIDQN